MPIAVNPIALGSISSIVQLVSTSQSMCYSFKAEILSGIHALGTTVVRGSTTPDVIKGALYLASASLSPTVTQYNVGAAASSGNEVPASGSYPTGGIPLSNSNSPSVSGTSGIWTPSGTWTTGPGFTGTSFDTILFYNSTQSNRAIMVYTFPVQTVIAGTFSLIMPVNNSSTALLKVS